MSRYFMYRVCCWSVNPLYLPDGIVWSTGIGVIDAAEAIVEEAVGNSNIPPKGE